VVEFLEISIEFGFLWQVLAALRSDDRWLVEIVKMFFRTSNVRFGDSAGQRGRAL
jgi:predicted helicase